MLPIELLLHISAPLHNICAHIKSTYKTYGFMDVSVVIAKFERMQPQKKGPYGIINNFVLD